MASDDYAKVLLNVKYPGSDDYHWELTEAYKIIPGSDIKDCIRLVNVKGKIKGIAVRMEDQYYNYDKYVSRAKLLEIMLQIS